MTKNTGIRTGGDFNAVDKAPVVEEEGATYYILAEDSKVLTDESGNQLRTE